MVEQHFPYFRQKKREETKGSPPDLFQQPTGQNSVIYLLQVVRKLRNQVPDSRCEKDKGEGALNAVSVPFNVIATVSIWKAMSGIDKNGSINRQYS